MKKMIVIVHGTTENQCIKYSRMCLIYIYIVQFMYSRK